MEVKRSKGGVEGRRRTTSEDGYLEVAATTTPQRQADRKGNRLFVEESGLGDRGGGGLAAGDAYYAEDGDFGECGAGNEDAVGVGV